MPSDLFFVFFVSAIKQKKTISNLQVIQSFRRVRRDVTNISFCATAAVT
jgi:hypothetical protein